MKRAFLALVVIAPFAAVAPAHAGTPTFELELAVDGPLLAVSSVVALTWLLGDELASVDCGLERCDSADVFVLDREFAGTYSEGWKVVSDAGIGALYAGAIATLLIDDPESSLNDAVVIVESVLASNAISALLNFATRRTRPLAYGTQAPPAERSRGRTALSFPSGHSAGAFAATMSLFVTMFRRHPESIAPWIVLGAGLTAATLIGVSRIAAGDHFPTDVLAGAAIGASIGTLIPSLHDSPDKIGIGASTSGASLRLRF